MTKARHFNLRKLAKDQSCLIRIPGHCIGGGETTVLCHIRMIGLSGMGLKAPDILGAFGCRACHSICDGQQKSEFSASERRLMLLEGMARTQLWFVEHGYVRY